MDLTIYTEEIFQASVKDLPAELDKPIADALGPQLLTPEENENHFYDFEKSPVLEAIFNGPGQKYYVDQPANLIPTWSFTDLAGKNWLVPQWLTMDVPQGTFQGFSKEPAGEFIYYIEYKDLVKTKNGHRHNITVFRKKV